MQSSLRKFTLAILALSSSTFLAAQALQVCEGESLHFDLAHEGQPLIWQYSDDGEQWSRVHVDTEATTVAYPKMSGWYRVGYTDESCGEKVWSPSRQIEVKPYEERLKLSWEELLNAKGVPAQIELRAEGEGIGMLNDWQYTIDGVLHEAHRAQLIIDHPGESFYAELKAQGNGKCFKSGGEFFNFGSQKSDSCDVNGGQISTSDNLSNICLSDGSSTELQFSVSGNSGALGRFGIVRAGTFDVVAFNSTGTFDLAGLPAGNYYAAHVSVDDPILLQNIENLSDLSGCYDLSNQLLLNLVVVDGGELNVVGPSTIEGGTVFFNQSGAIGPNKRFVLKNESGSEVIQVRQTGSFNFDNRPFGTYKVVHVAYGPGINLANVDPQQPEGCISLSNEIFIEHSPPCPGEVSDPDGNTYTTLEWEDQCWMKKNLRSTSFANGDAIELIPDAEAWYSTPAPAYSWYDNDSGNEADFGLLYNGFAVSDPRNVCPEGWHVPTDEEWTDFSNSLGGDEQAAAALKSIDTWMSSGSSGEDSIGFGATGGGMRSSFGHFNFKEIYAGWWTSTQDFGDLLLIRSMHYNKDALETDHGLRRAGHAIRCLKDEAPEVALPSVAGLELLFAATNEASVAANVTADGNDPITERGIIWGQGPELSLEDFEGSESVEGTLGQFEAAIAGLAPGTEYLIRAYATNGLGTGYSDLIQFSTTNGLTDIDGNYYNTLLINGVEWMGENLRVSHYADGAPILNEQDPDEWFNLSENQTGSWVHFNNDPAQDEVFGKLYNWYAVNDSSGLCPTGWRIPELDVWNDLVNYLDPNADGNDNNAGAHLKAVEGFNAPNLGATNSTGFTALAAGNRTRFGAYYGQNSFANFWAAEQSNQNFAWRVRLFFDLENLALTKHHKLNGYSIRCIKDE